MPVDAAEVRALLLELLRVLAPGTDPTCLGGDDDIRERLGMDSFDFLNLMMGLSDAFGVDIADADYNTLTTLNQLIAYVVKQSS